MRTICILITAVMMCCACGARAQMSPILTDTIRTGPPPQEEGPGKGTKCPGIYPTAVVSVAHGQMMIRFSEQVNCDIELRGIDGQCAVAVRLRDEDLAILDTSRLHGRFQLVIISDRWFATRAYWFP